MRDVLQGPWTSTRGGRLNLTGRPATTCGRAEGGDAKDDRRKNTAHRSQSITRACPSNIPVRIQSLHCPCPPARVSVRTRSSPRSALAGWARSIALATRSLHRPVAIKVLPDSLAARPRTDRVSGYDEAVTLASLGTIPTSPPYYGFAEADGRHALVLELVEGPTLAERIARGPLPIAGNDHRAPDRQRPSTRCPSSSASSHRDLEAGEHQGDGDDRHREGARTSGLAEGARGRIREQTASATFPGSHPQRCSPAPA